MNNQPIPITFANRDKIQFPCWLYNANSDSPFWWKCRDAIDWRMDNGCVTHYLSDQPDRPTCVPEVAAETLRSARVSAPGGIPGGSVTSPEALHQLPAPASATTTPSATLEQVAREAAEELLTTHDIPVASLLDGCTAILTRHFAGWVGPEQAKQHAEELQQVAEAFKMPFSPGRDVIQAAKDIVAERDAYAADWQKVVKVALACDPIPACERADNNLEPPWIVFERVRAERDDLKRRVEELNDVMVNGAGAGCLNALRADRDELKRQVEELTREVSGQAAAAIEMTGLAQKYHARLTEDESNRKIAVETIRRVATQRDELEASLDAADEQVRVLSQLLEEARKEVRNVPLLDAISAALATQPKEDRK